MTHDNEPAAVELAESLLAALESLVSTGLTERLVAHEPLARVFMKVSEFGEAPFSFRIVAERGRPVAYVACRPFNPHSLSYEDQARIKERLTQLVIELFARIVFIPQESPVLESLVGEDRALQRAVDFTGSFVVTANVLGFEPKTSIAQWVPPEVRTFRLTRSEAWDATLPAPQKRASPPEIDAREDGEPPANPPTEFPAVRSHSDLRTVSYIRVPLWDRAGWKGVAFATEEPEGAAPPILGLVFADAKVARDIFLGFQEDLGAEDREERLHLSIIRGISASNPAWYRVVLGPSADAVRASRGAPPAFATVITRSHTMQPEEPTNLDRFLASYRATGAYFLAPVILGHDGAPQIVNLRVRKSALHVRQAWEIGPDDLECVAIRDDDDVVIPEGVEDPPMARLRRWRFEARGRRG